MLRVQIIEERGYEVALSGLALSYGQDPQRMEQVARRLCFKGDGHNKFLESIVVWLDIRAPRYFWQQFDTYRVGVTKQSESTMHTGSKRLLMQRDFAHPIPDEHLRHLNQLIRNGEWQRAKQDLPESFLQRRIVCLNYMSLQRIIRQRREHRLPEWPVFVSEILQQAMHPELLSDKEA
jgi:hypothetical protein